MGKKMIYRLALIIVFSALTVVRVDVQAESQQLKNETQSSKDESPNKGEGLEREKMPVENANIMQGIQSPFMRRGLSWDIDLTGGYGFALRGDLKFPDALMGRLRAGGIVIQEPHMLSFGATTGLGGFTETWSLGMEIDYLHIPSGVSGKVGASYADKKTGIIHVGAAWALTGIEWQYKASSKGSDHAIFLMLKIPFGAAYYLATH